MALERDSPATRALVWDRRRRSSSPRLLAGWSSAGRPVLCWAQPARPQVQAFARSRKVRAGPGRVQCTTALSRHEVLSVDPRPVLLCVVRSTRRANRKKPKSSARPRMGRQVNHQTNSKRQIGSSVPSNMKQQVAMGLLLARDEVEDDGGPI